MKNQLRCSLLAATAAAALAAPLPAASAVDAFLKIDGIPGESTSKMHKDEIEILSWSWGMARPAGLGGAGMSRERPCITELNVMKFLDKASPKLMNAVIVGTAIPKATLTLTTSGEFAPINFFTVELSQVTVASVQDSGSSERPMESLALRFTSAMVTYQMQKDDGSPGDKFPVSLRAGSC
jgi:type VI secretion system secreted protein Hcp